MNVVDFHMNVQDAVDWPRFHHQWMPDDAAGGAGLFAGHGGAARSSAGTRSSRVNAQGEVAAILFDDGWLEGAADPRTEGTAEGR